LLVAGAQSEVPARKDLEAAFGRALSSPRRGSLSDIAKALARQFKVPRKQINDLALKLRESETNTD
jgi:hypothetical protein